ncbi:MAG: RNA polymerase sigma factor [Gammaproteobacteria bacterium]|nr:RNA polymerase sigma factor [Gammaproteobacteria bacterium]
MQQRSDQSDQELIAAIARRDTAALKQLYLDYLPRLRLFLVRVGCRDHEIDEVCNEAFFVVWQKAAAFRGDSRVATWVFGIARNKALKAIARRQESASRQAHVEPDTLSMQGLPAIKRHELRQWLDVGLGLLPPEQQQVLELAFIDGFSCAEIASVMGCPENTVKTRMFHARRKLRELLPAEIQPRSPRIPL